MTIPGPGRSLATRVARKIWLARRLTEWFRPSTESITRKNTRRAYDRLYGSEQHVTAYLSPERLAFYEELVTIVAPLAPRSVIDVGCGTGHLLRLLVDRMAATPERIVGIDHSDAGIRRARALLPSATWLVDDLYNMSVDEEPFDLVVCTEVLEHLHEPARAVEALCRLRAPRGRVAITVPDGAQDSWEGHVNFWDEGELRAFLEPHGLLTIERIEDGRVLLAWLASGAR